MAKNKAPKPPPPPPEDPPPEDPQATPAGTGETPAVQQPSTDVEPAAAAETAPVVDDTPRPFCSPTLERIDVASILCGASHQAAEATARCSGDDAISWAVAQLALDRLKIWAATWLEPNEIHAAIETGRLSFENEKFDRPLEDCLNAKRMRSLG